MADVKPEGERTVAVAAYKTVLKRVLDNRPSGTRHRLAIALQKNRSFISQIANPIYAVPIPAQHLETIFELCHFTVAEKREFLSAYTQAHHRRLNLVREPTRLRKVTITVPDTGDARRNRRIDEILIELARRLGRLAEDD